MATLTRPLIDKPKCSHADIFTSKNLANMWFFIITGLKLKMDWGYKYNLIYWIWLGISIFVTTQVGLGDMSSCIPDAGRRPTAQPEERNLYRLYPKKKKTNRTVTGIISGSKQNANCQELGSGHSTSYDVTITGVYCFQCFVGVVDASTEEICVRMECDALAEHPTKKEIKDITRTRGSESSDGSYYDTTFWGC